MPVTKFQGRGQASAPSRERGIALLGLLLLVALLVIAAAAVAPSIAFEIKRDREEELVHRGVQYSRGIRLFSKKTGGYPMRLEDLYNASGEKYVRKLYKDPITGGDFKPLHTADVLSLTARPNINSSQPQPGADDAAANADASASDPQSGSGDPAKTPAAGTPGGTATPPATGPASIGAGLAPDDPTKGIIFGVVSKSKAKSIREFNHKARYDQWLFFYDPTNDRGAEIKGPTSAGIPAAFPGQPGGAAQQQPSGVSPTAQQ